ncbi:MAG: helix-turn-helix domain-containing protein [bacterium]|nr:helix-turn-helix domain-containing protein [bacterium]
MKTIHFYLHSYGEHDENNKIGPVTWPHFDLLFVHEGEIFLHLLEGDHIRLGERQGVLIYPLTPFQGYALTEIARTSVQHFDINKDAHYKPQVVQSLLGKSRGYEIFQGEYSPNLFHNIDLTIRWATYEDDPFLYDLRVAAMVLVLGELKSKKFQKRKMNHHEEAIADLVDRLRVNWRAHGMSVDDMAREVELSTSHFRALFRNFVGASPGQFLFNLRMLEAKRYLRETLTPIKEISEKLGYKNLSHFYRAFKSHESISPREYRDKNIIRG